MPAMGPNLRSAEAEGRKFAKEMITLMTEKLRLLPDCYGKAEHDRYKMLCTRIEYSVAAIVVDDACNTF